jgi:hypothetical protein
MPTQSFLGPSPVGLAIIFYCLTFETSLFVASYDSQGHGGGIRPHLHTGLPILVSVALLITLLHGPNGKRCFQQYLYCVRIRCRGTCLPSRCLETAIHATIFTPYLHLKEKGEVKCCSGLSNIRLLCIAIKVVGVLGAPVLQRLAQGDSLRYGECCFKSFPWCILATSQHVT